MDLGLRGKRALITGASQGIGRAIAQMLAAEGCAVAAVARDAAALEALVKSLPGSGHSFAAVDVMEGGLGPRIAKGLNAEASPFEIIVNNVGGTLEVTDPFAPIEDWRRVMRLNFDAAVEINLQFVPGMRARRSGRIVNVTSVAAVEWNGPAPYAAAKAAMLAYTRCVGRLLAADDVVMTCVLPGVVRTEGGYWERMEKEDPAYVARYLKERCPQGRLGTPKEIAGVVAFLASTWSSFAPGSAWSVDGGQLRSYAH